MLHTFSHSVYQVKVGIVIWLAWLLKLERPGRKMSRKAFMESAARDDEAKCSNRFYPISLSSSNFVGKSSRSLMSNILDLDDDLLVVGNGKSSSQANGRVQTNNPANKDEKVFFFIAREQTGLIPFFYTGTHVEGEGHQGNGRRRTVSSQSICRNGGG